MANKVSFSARIDPELEAYLNRVSDNKSSYVEDLIREDKKRNDIQNSDPITEINKCKNDPFYFIRNYCYLKDSRGGFKMVNLYNYYQTVFQNLMDGENVLLVKGRQIGASTLIALYSLWRTLFHSGYRSGFAAPKMDLGKNLMDKFRNSYKKLPDWMHKNLIQNNKLEFRFRDKSEVKYISETGRSQSFNFLGIDEASFIDSFGRYWDAWKMCNAHSTPSSTLITTNGIHKSSSNWEILKDMYKSDGFTNVVVPRSQIVDKSEFENQKDVLGREKFEREFMANVELDD